MLIIKSPTTTADTDTIRKDSKQALQMSRLVTRKLVGLGRRSSSCLNTFTRGFSEKKDSEVVDASKVIKLVSSLSHNALHLNN